MIFFLADVFYFSLYTYMVYAFWSVHRGVFIQTVLCHYCLRSMGAFVFQIDGSLWTI